MNDTNSYIFRGLSDIECANLMHDTDYVLKWGILERTNEIKGVCEIIPQSGMKSRVTKPQIYFLLKRGNVSSKTTRDAHWR